MFSMDLEDIGRQVSACKKCGLCKTRKNAVPGKGNPKAEIVFVGEAPGSSEDRSGEPFVGPAGKKLTEALEKAGLKREDVYITNVVKCRPPGNRVPREEERDACATYLEVELNTIKPKIVCILGNTASMSLLGQTGIKDSRGKVIERSGRRYFLTFHPAATIYNRRLTPAFESDIAALVKIVRESESRV